MKNLVCLLRPLAVVCLSLGLTGASLGQGLLDRLSSADRSGPDRPQRLQVEHVEASLAIGQTDLRAGEPLQILVTLKHAPDWHTYWLNPGDAGLPTQIRPMLEGQALPIEARQWPVPGRYPVGSLASYGYEGTVTLGLTSRLPRTLSPGSHALAVDVSWLVCKDVCIPGEASLGLVLQVQDGRAAIESEAMAAMARLTESLPRADGAGQGYAIDTDRKRLKVWGLGDFPRAGGYLFSEIESLVLPSGAQALYATSDGWLLDMPLAETPSPGLRALDQAKTLGAVWRPQSSAPAEAAGLELRFSPGTPPTTGALISAGLTAQEAYEAKTSTVPTAGGAHPNWAEAWSFWAALGGAFLGGLILNLMPCVFPVLGLKVLSLSGQAHAGRAAWGSALLFTAGVWLSMLALAGLMLGLRAAGETLGWGFQLQNPVVVTGLALLFLAIGLNLLGAFEFGSRLTQLGRLDQGHGPWSAFGSGVLAVVVASPCTAPFMGGALGFTLTATAFETLLIFSSLGLGLAFPFALLSIRPSLLAWLPKPGQWMDDFRTFLAFPMLATVAWLTWVLTVQRGADAVLPLLLGMVLMALGLLLAGRAQQRPDVGGSIDAKTSRLSRWMRRGLIRLIIWIAAGALLVQAAGLWGGGVHAPDQGPVASVSIDRLPALDPMARGADGAAPGVSAQAMSGSPDQAIGPSVNWQAWAPGLAEDLAREGRVVFVDFTAAWCISCQVNKLRVLQTSPVAEALARPEVAALMADWTSRNPEITKELARFGRSGVPVYLVYPAGGGQPRLLSEWLSAEEVMDALLDAGLR